MPFSLLSCCSSNNIKKTHSDDETVHSSKVSPIKESPPVVTNYHQPVVPPTPNPVPVATTKPPVKKPSLRTEPYSSQRAQELFKTYADNDDPNEIGPDGFEQLCNDADMKMDGARPIIFAWQFGAKELAKITKEEWITGTSTLRVSSIPLLTLSISELENLLIYDKPAVKVGPKKDQEYDRSSYLSCAADTKAGFQKLYQFCFSLAKSETSRNIEMETSVGFWSVLLVPKFPIMKEVLEFIAEKGTYKATNKDLWTMMLEFCETVKPSLQDYEADGAWPTLLDDFVIWKKSSSGNGTAGDMDVDH